MNWILFVLLAVLIWAISNLIDKFVEDHEVGDSILSAGIVDLTGSLLFIFVPIVFTSTQEIFSSFSWLALISGVIYGLARLTYYTGLKYEEVSRFIPLLAMGPIFVTIYSYFFLGISFVWQIYLGIFLVILGAVLVSLKNPLDFKHSFQSKTAVILGILAAFFYAVKDVSTKIASNSITFWPLIFWIGVGFMLISLLMVADKINKLNNNTKALRHLAGVGALKAIGYFVFTKAITLGPVALVVTMLQIKSLFVFIGSTLISRYHPEIIHEKLDKKTLLQKGAATIIIIAGVSLVKLFS